MLAVVESINAAIGVTKSPVIPSVIQVLNSWSLRWGMKEFSVYLVVMPQFSEKSQLVKIFIGIGKTLFYLNKEEKFKPQEYFPK